MSFFFELAVSLGLTAITGLLCWGLKAVIDLKVQLATMTGTLSARLSTVESDLKHVNKAVNNVADEEKTLREMVVDLHMALQRRQIIRPESSPS